MLAQQRGRDAVETKAGVGGRAAAIEAVPIEEAAGGARISDDPAASDRGRTASPPAGSDARRQSPPPRLPLADFISALADLRLHFDQHVFSRIDHALAWPPPRRSRTAARSARFFIADTIESLHDSRAHRWSATSTSSMRPSLVTLNCSFDELLFGFVGIELRALDRADRRRRYASTRGSSSDGGVAGLQQPFQASA